MHDHRASSSPDGLGALLEMRIFAAMGMFGLVSLSACSGGGSDSETSAILADAKRFNVENAEHFARRATDGEYALYRSVLKASGLEAELGGPQVSDSALHALMDKWRREAIGIKADIPRLLAAAEGNPGDLGMTGLGVSTMVGVASGLLAGYQDKAATINRKVGDSSVKVDVSDGRIGIHAETLGNIEGGLTGAVITDISYDRCPDADGRVRISFKSQSGLARKDGAKGGKLSVSVEMTRSYDDNAELTSEMEYDIKVESATIDSASNRESGFIAMRSRVSTFDPSSGLNEQETGSADEAAESQKQMAKVMAAGILQQASSGVMSGQCVTLNATSVPAGRSGVKPSTPFTVSAKPRGKIDGRPTGGMVTAALSGKGRLDPAGSPVAADATFNYVAPDKKDQSGTVSLESRSRRGVGKATLDFDTKQSVAFFAQGGGGDYRGTGTICDLSKPFVISGTGVTNTFTPSGPTIGSYSYSGPGVGFPVWGSGTYHVELGADGKSGKLIATGPGSVRTPMGVVTGRGTENYALSPAERCK